MKAKLIALSILTLVIFGAVSSGPGQDDDRRARMREQMKKRLEQRQQQTKKKAPEKPKDMKVTALVGADVYTVTHEVIRGGTILVQEGKILDLGQDLEVPKGATVIDASGKTITPGFITLNMSGLALRVSSSDRSAKYQDSLDPYDRNMKIRARCRYHHGLHSAEQRQILVSRGCGGAVLGIGAERMKSCSASWRLIWISALPNQLAPAAE